MRKGKPLVLVADDMLRYVTSIKIILEANGYEILTASDGEMAVALAVTDELDLILMDIRMPKMDGLQASVRIREFSSVPIIMFTALGEEKDIVAGLEAGADDYIIKPFGADELLARIKATLRRSRIPSSSNPVVFATIADLTVDFAGYRVTLKGNDIDLTSTEFRLLAELAKATGKVLTTDVLLERIWGKGYEGEEHLVWKVIHRLRKKIEENPKYPLYIHTKPGVGYLLEKH